MAFPKASSKGGGDDFEPVSAGLHYARLFALIDLGIQKEEYQGKPKETHKILFGFEFPDETITYTSNGKEITAPKILWPYDYTLSLSPKARLRRVLESWLGKTITPEVEEKLDLEKLIGRPAQVSIVHKIKDGKTRGQLNNDIILPATAEQAARARAEQLHNQTLVYSTETPKVHYDRLPEWIKRKVDARVVGGQSKAGQESQAQDEFDDSIPF